MPPIEKRRIDALKPHPKQRKLFGEIDRNRMFQLSKSIKKEGLHNPVEILPDNTIICGHHRVEAVKFNRETEIDCIVRHDLAAAGDQAVVERLIDDNLTRGQLSLFSQIRLVREKLVNAGERHYRGTLRDEVGRRIGKSGRTVDRLMRVLETPRVIQEAFENKQVSFADVNRFLGLNDRQRQQVLQKIAAGQKAKLAIPQGTTKAKRKPRPGRVVDRLIDELRRAQADLGDSLKYSQFDSALHQPTLEALKQGTGFLTELTRKYQRGQDLVRKAAK